MLRGRSQLVESFFWLVPPVRIDRLTALSSFNRSWCMAVLRSWSHLSGYSRFCVHFEKEEREEKSGKRKEEREKKKREKKQRRKKETKEKEKRKKEKEKQRTREREKRKEKKGNISSKKHHKTKNIHRTNCHIMFRKIKNAGLNYLALFLRKFRISPCFILISRFEFDFRVPGN